MRLALDLRTAGAVPAAGSGQATLRHTWSTAYGCSLPGLTGFTAPGRAGPNHQRCLPGAARSFAGRRRVIGPAYRGFPVQGTPNPPPSTAPPRILLRTPADTCRRVGVARRCTRGAARAFLTHSARRAVGAGFEPARGVNPQSLSRRSRYGRFGTPPGFSRQLPAT